MDITFLSYSTICDTSTATIGIILSVIGVVMSFIAIILTYRIQRAVLRQPFKQKQYEIMAELVHDLNDFEFQVVYNRTGKIPVYKNVNLVGLVSIDSRDEGYTYDYEAYKRFPVTYADNFSFGFLKKYISNAYIPQKVAKQLYLFLNQNLDEVVFDNKDNNIELFLCGEKNSLRIIFQQDSIYSNYDTFMQNIVKLVDSISKWYYKELHNTPNFISVNYLYMQSKDEDIEKKLLKSRTQSR